MKKYVTVFDNTLYINDNDTPLSLTMRPAEIVAGPYLMSDGREVIDVVFLYNNRRSNCHLTSAILPNQYFE